MTLVCWIRYSATTLANTDVYRCFARYTSRYARYKLDAGAVADGDRRYKKRRVEDAHAARYRALQNWNGDGVGSTIMIMIKSRREGIHALVSGSRPTVPSRAIMMILVFRAVPKASKASQAVQGGVQAA